MAVLIAGVCFSVVLNIFNFSVLCSEHQFNNGTTPDYDDYLEDMSLIGKTITCLEEEKECYKFGRVLYEDGNCYMLSHIGPCHNGEFLFNKDEVKRGIYRAECQPHILCKAADEMFMAYDQKCYQSDLVHEMCSVKKNLSISQNVFGEIQCSCFGESCPPRPIVIQPEEIGRCRLPDLVHEGFPYWHDRLADHVVPCSQDERACLKQGKLFHETSKMCFRLLEKGPCDDGEIFTANSTMFEKFGQLVGSCSKPRCPEGKVRMQFDGRCYLQSDALHKICPPHVLVHDVFGDVGCGFDQDLDVAAQLPHRISIKGECVGRHRQLLYDHLPGSDCVK